MSNALPPGFLTIEAAEPPNDPVTSPDYLTDEHRRVEFGAIGLPEQFETGTPAELVAQLYGSSGSPETYEYREATKFRDMASMDWAEARVALNRLVRELRGDRYYRRNVATADLVALAEFAMTARDFTFQGKKGDNGGKLRKELADAIIVHLRPPLTARLQATADNAKIIARPIAEHLRDGWKSNDALQAMVPLPDGTFVQISQATPEEAFASLDFMRRWLADREEQRSFADGVANRLYLEGSAVTAKDYAAAISIADTREFMSAKLIMLHAGIANSIPLYRLYPATPECEAIKLWCPWGRAMPLVDSGPSKAPRSRKKVLDPAIITVTRPQDVVREVIERTGINRTTAQRMTADMRADMRRKRKALALSLLRKGETRTGVARAVGLSPSRISAMFKNQNFPTKKSNAELLQRLRGDDQFGESTERARIEWRRRPRRS
jgi:hypothetical protein